MGFYSFPLCLHSFHLMSVAMLTWLFAYHCYLFVFISAWMKTVLRTKCQLKKRRDKCAQTLRMCSRSQIESDCSQPLLGVGGQFCQFPALALLSGQRLSLTVRLHSPLLNVLSGCLWLGVLYPEVCHFFLWPLDLIPALQRLVPPLYAALKVHL